MTVLLTPAFSLPALEQLLATAYSCAGEASADVCRTLRAALDVDVVLVSRLDGDGGIRLVAVDDPQELGLMPGTHLPSGESFCERALTGQAPAVTGDLAMGPYADVPARTALGLHSYAMVPLRDADGYQFGALAALDRRSVLPGPDGEQLMRLLGGLLGREHELDRVRHQQADATTALHDRAAELENAKDSYRSLVNEMRDIVVRVGPDGSIAFVNQAWTELTGISVQDTLGKGCFDHVHPDDQVAAAEHIASVAAGVDDSAREIRFRSADGSYRWMAVRGRGLHDEDGALVGVTGMLQDVTERRRSQEQVQEALAEAERARDQAEKALAEAERASRAKSEFLSRMSHELRTPLNAILGFGQLLELSALDGQDGEHVDLIMGAGRHLLELINEVLDVVRIESGRLSLSLEPVPVGPVVTESLALVRTAAADRGLVVTSPAATSGLHVVADQQRLKQVLVNLLSNAVKYNRAGGRLAVTVGVVPDEPDAASSRWLRIAVTDTGRGIPEDRWQDAFTAFERLGAEETDIEGSGIGLSVSKSLVEAMGGRLGVHSELGVGSTFFVDLPAAPPTDLDPADQTESGGADPRATVLYVEDNRSNITLMERVLALRPHVRLLVARDGAQGLEQARTERPDLVLLDLHLPELSGAEVLAALRADQDPGVRAVPVVIVTADLSAGTERRMLKDGATAFLTKPIDIAGLLAVVDAHLPAQAVAAAV